MALNDYLNLKKDAKKRIDTLQFSFRNAYNKAEDTTRDSDGYIDLSSLDNSSDRDAFKTKFTNEILGSARDYFKITPKKSLDLFQENLLMNGYMGFSGIEINQIMDSAKGNISYEGMAKTLEDNIESIMKRISTIPSTKLEESDANDVASYTNTVGIINPTKLQIPNMVELISEYEKNGIVTPKFINEKPYKI